jgi:hypothetical protein
MITPRNAAYLMRFLRLGEHPLGDLVLLYLVTMVVNKADAWLTGLFGLLAVLVVLFTVTGEVFLVGGIVAVSIAIGAVLVIRIITRR